MKASYSPDITGPQRVWVENASLGSCSISIELAKKLGNEPMTAAHMANYDGKPPMNFLQLFQNAMDLQQPDWFITFATQQELTDLARRCTDGHSGTVAAKNALRHEVATRLIMPLRACVHAGLATVEDGS